jgi:hypothetical protein
MFRPCYGSESARILAFIVLNLHQDISNGGDGGIGGEDDWPVVSGIVEWTECWQTECQQTNYEVLDDVHSCYFFCSEMKCDIFAC